MSLHFNSLLDDNHQFWKDYATREINALLWVSLIAVTALLLRKLIKLLILWTKGRLIPGPPCPFFYGHSHLISQSNLTDLLSKSHEMYGSVVKLWLGPSQLLVSLKDPEVIKEMLLKAEDKLPLTGRAFRLAFGRSSFFVSSFDKVKKRRDSLAKALNGKLLDRANVVPSEVVNSLMEKIENIVTKGGLNCEIVSQHLAFTILGTTLFGDAFLTWSKAIDYEELLMMIAKDACFWASYNVTPYWKWGFWRYQNLCTKLKFLTQDIIQLYRQDYRIHFPMHQNSCNGTKKTGEAGSGAPHSLGDVMPDNPFLWEFNGHLDSRDEPCGNIVSVMFHGSLTTAGLIGNILARLALHPEIQDKIHSEIKMARKVSNEEDQQDVDKMVFLLATVYESARLLPAGPLLQRCSLKHDLNLKAGLSIPAAAIIVVPVQLVQTDDSSWGSDASQFNPSRFLSKAEKRFDLDHLTSYSGSPEELVDAARSSYILDNQNENAAFLPFGSGARACVGQKLAILGVARLFASLLENYEVRLQSGSEGEIDPKPMINNCVLQLLPSPKIVFTKRNC